MMAVLSAWHGLWCWLSACCNAACGARAGTSETNCHVARCPSLSSSYPTPPRSRCHATDVNTLADSFDCGNDCVQSPTSYTAVDPDAPNAVDEVVGGPLEPSASPGSPLAEAESTTEQSDEAAFRASAQEAPQTEGETAPTAAKAPPQGLAMLPPPRGMKGDQIRQRHGPAGMSGDSGPAPI